MSGCPPRGTLENPIVPGLWVEECSSSLIWPLALDQTLVPADLSLSPASENWQREAPAHV